MKASDSPPRVRIQASEQTKAQVSQTRMNKRRAPYLFGEVGAQSLGSCKPKAPQFVRSRKRTINTPHALPRISDKDRKKNTPLETRLRKQVDLQP